MLLMGFNQASPANTLVAYLNGDGIPCKLINTVSEQGQPQFQVVLLQDADTFRAREIAQRFLQNPNHPDFSHVAWQQSGPAKLNYTNVLSLNNIKRDLLAVPFTSSLLLIALLIHFLVFAAGQFQLFNSLSFQPFAVVLENGEAWRLLTPTLMHFSILHLAFNLMWWFWLGRDIETKLSARLLVTVYLLSGLVSNYAQFMVSGDNFGGLSGVVYALLAFCWWLGWQRPRLGLTVPNSIMGFMLIWLIIGFADVLWISMANTAHLVGLLSGCLMGQLYVLLNKPTVTSPGKGT